MNHSQYSSNFIMGYSGKTVLIKNSPTAGSNHGKADVTASTGRFQFRVGQGKYCRLRLENGHASTPRLYQAFDERDRIRKIPTFPRLRSGYPPTINLPYSPPSRHTMTVLNTSRPGEFSMMMNVTSVGLHHIKPRLLHAAEEVIAKFCADRQVALIPIALNSCPSFHRRIIIKADRKGTYI
jgi:hypothetical protein